MKTTTMNISLPAELARYVRERVEGGHYSSASEVGVPLLTAEYLEVWAEDSHEDAK
jgi:Arc/MetJ-type ribon-helix-helix transcriptional regulator